MKDRETKNCTGYVKAERMVKDLYIFMDSTRRRLVGYLCISLTYSCSVTGNLQPPLLSGALSAPLTFTYCGPVHFIAYGGTGSLGSTNQKKIPHQLLMACPDVLRGGKTLIAAV